MGKWLREEPGEAELFYVAGSWRAWPGGEGGVPCEEPKQSALLIKGSPAKREPPGGFKQQETCVSLLSLRLSLAVDEVVHGEKGDSKDGEEVLAIAQKLTT